MCVGGGVGKIGVVKNFPLGGINAVPSTPIVETAFISGDLTVIVLTYPFSGGKIYATTPNNHVSANY